MHILGIDLATRRYADIGMALLTPQRTAIRVEIIRPSALLRDPPSVAALMRLVAQLNQKTPIHVVAVDGPQGWQDPQTGLPDARVCERRLNTQAKSGLPGHAKPRSSLRFVQFSVDLFDAFAQAGWPRFGGPNGGSPAKPVAIEVYPTAAWRALGLRPLPSKAAARRGDEAVWLAHLQRHFDLSMVHAPSHDELQAVVAGLVGLTLAAHGPSQVEVCGLPPRLVDGAWREGPIVNFRPSFNYRRSAFVGSTGSQGSDTTPP